MIEHNPWNPVTRAIVRRCPVDRDAELLSAPAAKTLLRSAGFEILDTVHFLYLPRDLFTYFGRIERVFGKVPLGGQFAVFARYRTGA